MTSTPVVMIIFSRERVTRRNLEALRQIKPSRLFVIADGPRTDRADDAENCATARAVIDEIDWPCEVQRKFAEQNIGLDANIELGLDWVFSQVDRAIILEDDCIADPSFFRYCDELLDRYADNPRVWQIAGDNHGVPTSMFGDDSYRFSTWASVWGWATWADRWNRHRANFNRTHEGAETYPGSAPAVRVRPAPPQPGSLGTAAAERHFSFVAECEDGNAYFWDHHWWVTVIAEGGLSAMPRVTVIENDGFGEGATNTRADKEPEPAQSLKFPLTHPEVGVDLAIESELELILLRTDGRMSRLVRKIIRPLWLRSIIRRIITIPIVWKVVRRVVGR